MNSTCRESGDMIIANDSESICMAQWPGPGIGVGEDEDDEDTAVAVASGGIDNGACRGGGRGVWHLYDGLTYGDAAYPDASLSGYFRFQEAEGSIMGTTAGRRLSSPPGSTAGAGSGVTECEVDRCQTEDDDAEGERVRIWQIRQWRGWC
jgi:hypothetical protein